MPSVIQIDLLSPVGAAGKQRRRFPNCCAQFETIWERGGAVEPGSDPGLAERRVMTEPGGRASPRAARIATGAASRGGVEGDVRVTRGEGRSGRVETRILSLDVALRTERRVKVFGLGKRGDTSRQGERSRSFSKMTVFSVVWKNLLHDLLLRNF